MKTRQNIVAICFDRSGRMLSVGRNNYTKTHPVQKRYADRANIPQKIYLHAEIDALTKLPYGAIPKRMVIVRRNSNGLLLPSKPCPICELAIKDYGITNVEYTQS